MKAFKPTLQQAFDAMMNSSRVLLSEEKRAEFQKEYNEEIEAELTIERIDRNGALELYSEGVTDVLYDIELDDVLIIE